MGGRGRVVSSLYSARRGGTADQSTGDTRWSPKERDVIVGRSAELDALAAALESTTRRGDGRLAVSGEAGIGKSLLLRRLREQATKSGLRIASGRATEFEQDVPFGLAIDVLGRLFDDPAHDLSRLGEERLAELRAVFPAFSSAGSHARGLAIERFRLHHAVRAALEELGQHRGLLVVFDDVHWADEPSAELLAHLLSHGCAGPICIAVAYRPIHLPRMLSHALASGVREGTTTLLEVGPLDRADAQRLLGVDGGAHFEECYHQSGGNPFFLTELARSLPADNPDATQRRMGEAAVPPAVQQAITHEFDSVSPDARALAQAAAVAGEPFDIEFAAAVAAIARATALSALDELTASGLVRAIDSAQLYMFRHPIVRHAVYTSVGDGARIAAHARAATLLAGAGAPLAARAHHVERSASPGDGQASDLLSAAATASASRAPAVAAGWLRAAIRLLPPDTSEQRRIELLVALANSLSAAGRLEDSRAALSEATLLVPEHDAVGKARLLGALVRLDHLCGDARRQASSRLRDALAQLGDTASVGVTAVTLELASDHAHLGDWAETVRLAKRACTQARSLDEPILEASGASILACGRYYLGDTAATVRSVDRASGVVDRLTDAELVAHTEAIGLLAAAEIGVERYDDGVRHAERALAIARASNHGRAFPAAMAALSMAHLWLGNLRDGAKLAEAVIEATHLARNTGTFWALGFRSWAALLLGDLDDAIRYGERGTAMGESLSAKGFGWFLQWSAGLAQIESGEVARGRERILIHCGGPELSPIELGWRPYCYAMLCSAELSLGDVGAAADWARRAQSAAEQLGLPGKLADARLAASNVALARGQPVKAAADAAAAARDFVGVGRTVDAARAWLGEGRALLEMAEQQHATERFEQAYFALARCGAARYRDEAAQRLRALGRRVIHHGQSAYACRGLGVLSCRQRQVAELITRGLKNREIADEMFVSLKTVESHIAQVFDKLGVSSRAAVASMMERMAYEDAD
ncbi:hypothetical protein DI005_37805 [Prauserella sp. PE36]|nr:hypothetical protein DI005_37805 [Prauserella sp. PE36]